MDAPASTAHPKPVIGLLGGPGSGKSTVARAFESLGCEIIDADQLAHQAIQADQIKQQLRTWWGDDVLTPSGQIDRKAVGRIVFNSEAELRRLESVLHPLVNAGRLKRREYLFAQPDCVAVIEDCPLLLETGLDRQCDALVFIDCPFDVRLERLSASRGWDASELRRREERQAPLDTKRQSADYVISNAGPDDSVLEQARGVLQQIV
ncbi:MAG: dephospho-CoA kinase [Verrucomicrobiales bacterium]|nr:dephospho-CoA kinase [Verrucomicrobiales bacterium]